MVGMSAAFFTMVGRFMLIVGMALVFSMLLRPVYLRVLSRLKGRKAVSAAIGLADQVPVMVVAIVIAGLVEALNMKLRARAEQPVRVRKAMRASARRREAVVAMRLHRLETSSP